MRALVHRALPVFLPLRELGHDARASTEAGLVGFVHAQVRNAAPGLPQGFAARLLERGRLLLLFDGLDEVPDRAARARVANAIERLGRHFPDAVSVVTCRFAGYGGAARLGAQFLELHLRPLTREQAEEFVRNWYRIVETGLAADNAAGEAEARRRSDDLLSRLKEPEFRSARLVEMTRNPLLLANLCLVHRDRGALPRGRARLYDECVDVLLERWRESKALGVSVTAEVGRRVLQPAALWLHGEEQRTRASAEELAPVIEPALAAAKWQGGGAADFLRKVRDESGLLTGWSENQYGFMHLGFQEYLAACELKRRACEGDTAVLAELAAHYGQSWWLEVILLLLSMGNPSLFVPFMRELVKHDAFARDLPEWNLLLEDAAEVSPLPFVEVLERAPGKDGALWLRQARAFAVLDRLGESAALDRLQERLAKHPSKAVRDWVRVRSTRDAFAKLGGPLISAKGGVELVSIPAGTFSMGSPPDERDREADETQHEVTLSAFELGKYTVTNEQYARFLAENPGAREPELWSDRRFNQPNQPVVGVSWDEARAFCAWAGGRLPTEAEWEYACRAGTTTRYWSGDEETDLARAGWYGGNSRGQLHPVGEKPANAFGLHDVHGNVWEWCADWYGEFPTGATQVDPTSPASGDSRVLRGGSWFSHARRALRAPRPRRPGRPRPQRRFSFCPRSLRLVE
ncbi:MAG TPA: SUMF1/EgtB/PvdO family nonheme iron enzyme, partial [Polyangiaceae bacterium]